ncbi:MAG: hypothetical protein KC503_45555 [Myxococcales bacterium]|nr:hypothetical protein [Myxococcales bacterium]
MTGATEPVRRVAALDVGSNSVLLLVAERRDGELLEVAEHARTTRLADHSAVARERTFSAIIDLVGEARRLGVETIGAVGTAALRVDENAQAFLAAVHASAGVELEVVDAEREAQLALAGALTDVGPLEGPWLMCDVGGASTELARVEAGRAVATTSLYLGAVTVPERTERAGLVLQLRSALADIGAEGVAGVLALGGSATTLAAMTLELQPYDPARISRYTLAREAIEGWITQLLPLPPAQRRVAGLALDRAPIIVGGAMILAAALDAARVPSALVTDRCLRWGLALELLS